MGDTQDSGFLTRSRALTLALILATALALYLCFLIFRPFFSSLAWALALAVIAHPLHRAICRKIKSDDLAAALTLIIVALVVVAPMLWAGAQLGGQLTAAVAMLQEQIVDGKWKETLAENPAFASTLAWIQTQFNLGGGIGELVKTVSSRIPALIKESAWTVVELLVTFFVLFYFFRDRKSAIDLVRSLSPLTDEETARTFKRVSETIRHTVFGKLVVALVQGALGGLMFWWLGLPAPLLWGAAMALLALIPTLGPFVIWGPAALFLALNGDWIEATILALWGGIVVALIDNLLYPLLVGSKLRLHTVPVFFAIVGGLLVFGTSGLILGPVILAVTVALLEVWRDRTRAGRTADSAQARGIEVLENSAAIGNELANERKP
jgi:predicted PurR-regulated permease PerM